MFLKLHLHIATHTHITLSHYNTCTPKDGAMMRDVILAIRADEAHHRVVNHTLSTMKPKDTNPYGPGE